MYRQLFYVKDGFCNVLLIAIETQINNKNKTNLIKFLRKCIVSLLDIFLLRYNQKHSTFLAEEKYLVVM